MTVDLLLNALLPRQFQLVLFLVPSRLNHNGEETRVAEVEFSFAADIWGLGMMVYESFAEQLAARLARCAESMGHPRFFFLFLFFPKSFAKILQIGLAKCRCACCKHDGGPTSFPNNKFISQHG